MIPRDWLYIMRERQTFTVADLQNDTGLTISGVTFNTRRWIAEGWLEMVMVGKNQVFALKGRAAEIAAKLPPLDAEEMCLPLTFEGIISQCRVCGVFLTREPRMGQEPICADCWVESRLP